MIFKKFTPIISLFLCLLMLFETVSLAQTDTQNQIGLTYVGTHTESQSVKAEIWFIFAFFRAEPDIGAEILNLYWLGSEFTILKFEGSYCLVKDSNGNEGYIHRLLLREKNNNNAGNNGNLKLNRAYEHVFVDGTNADSSGTPRVKAVYNGTGTVKWSTDRPDLIEVNPSTGLITGKKAGKANLIASVNSVVKVSIPVYCIYRWKSNWTGSAKTSSKIYAGNSVNTSELTTMTSGTKFYVRGDDGGSAGMAYGYATVSGKQYWGFVEIKNISTKNTVSYYNKLTISYPIKDTEIKYVSSPYSERSNDLHRGLDITGGGSYIYGKELISPVNGKVVFVNISCKENNTKPSYGYCITIESNGGNEPKTAKKDSVTDQFFTITFMHMSEAPILKVGDKVKVGDVVGKIGNTGNVSGSPGINPEGTHLHIEINNMAAIMGSGLRTDFTYNINPIYFYMDKKFTFNTGSSAYKNYGAYWYGPDK